MFHRHPAAPRDTLATRMGVVFEPISTTTLMYASLAATAVGTVAQVATSLSQGRAQQQASNYNATVARRNAEIVQQQSEMDAQAQQRDATRRLGAMRAGYGAAGVTVEGSPLDVLAGSAQAAELDREMILYKGRLQAMGYRDQATLDEARGRNAMDNAYMGAGAALLTGAANAGKIGMSMAGGPAKPAAAAATPDRWLTEGFGT